MGFSTPAALRSLDLFGIIHTNPSRLPLHTNARTAPQGFTAVTWRNPPDVFEVLTEGVLDGFWCWFGSEVVRRRGSLGRKFANVKPLHDGLRWQPGNGRGGAAVALPWQDAVLRCPRRSAALGESQLEKQMMNSITFLPFLFFHPRKIKKDTVRGSSNKFKVSCSLVSCFSLIWWRGTFYKGV